MTLTSDFRSFIRLPKKTAMRLAILAVLPLLILFGFNRWSAKGAWGITSTKPAPQVTFNTALQMAYFAQDNEWDSTVVLNNNAKDERFILVTLYGKNGRQANIPVFSIPANSIRRFKLSDWSLGVNDFREGNINVAFNGKPMEITGQVSVVNSRDRLEFESKPSMSADYSSQRLNGIVALPDRQAKAYVALTNTSANSIEVSLTSDAEHVHADKVKLLAHETKVEEIKLKNGNDSPLSALVTLQHNGAIGALITTAFATNKQTGFTANLYFYDDAKGVSNRLAGAHFRFGAANPSEGFPAGTTFTAPLVLANLGAVPTTATLTVDYTKNGLAKTQSIGSFTLQSRAIKEIELQSALASFGVTGPIDNAGIDIKYTGTAGTLVGQLTSMSQNGDFSFDTPLKDPLISSNRTSGSYPFRLDGGYNTVLHLKNMTDKKVRAVVQIRYDGGTYHPDQFILEPFQTVGVDIKKFQSQQTKDIRDGVLPANVTSGKVLWSERDMATVIGRAETTNIGEGIAGSFSCPWCSCPPHHGFFYMTPYSLSSVVGDAGYPFIGHETLYGCDDIDVFGPYGVSGYAASWSSSNASVASVGNDGYVQCLVPGTSNILMDYYTLLATDNNSPNCDATYGMVGAQSPIQVVQVTGVTAQGAEMITSVVGNQSFMHFVTPKGGANETVTLTATISPNTTDAINQITWEGATQNPNNRLQATVPKNSASKKTVKVKIGNSVAKELRVWIVWTTISSTEKTDSMYDDLGTQGRVRGGYNFSHSIQPSSIITDSNRPDLTGANVFSPPGGLHWTGNPLSLGANRKWDNSRQIRTKWLLPTNITPTDISYPSLPLPDGITYPTNTALGNDDRSVDDETNDPYANSGNLTGNDLPSLPISHALGNNGDIVELRLHFREFARLELMGTWYRISDDYLWRIHLKMKKQNNKWVNNGTNKALNNDGF